MLFVLLHSQLSHILKEETMFTWAGQGLSNSDHLHIITDLTAFPVWNRRACTEWPLRFPSWSCCINIKILSRLSGWMHAVINPVIVLFLGWEVGLGSETVRVRPRTGQAWGEEKRRGARQVSQLKPSSYFCAEFASQCSYCSMGFTRECQTVLRGLLSNCPPATLHVEHVLWLQKQTHMCRHESVYVSCNTKCCCAVRTGQMSCV